MNTKYIWIILLIFIIALIIFILNKQVDKEPFEDYILPVEKVDDIENIASSIDYVNKQNIFVGTGERINQDVNLGTNNTIFIKDGISISGKKYLDINTLKNIKYPPYNFKDKICIGNSCINKYHIKMLKGEIPFTMNTFFKPQPFQLFSAPDYWDWKFHMNAERRGTIGTPKPGENKIPFPIQSVKITDPNFKLIGYSEPNFQGQSYTVSGVISNVTTITVNGEAVFKGGFKSIIPQGVGSNMAQNTCLSYEFPFQFPPAFIHQPMFCNNNNVNQLFYIHRNDQLGIHSHPSGEEIHFHDHLTEEEIHGGDT
tara:strand:+ start:545 stop:1480 length:936 start_codon:yes stop_codon:yes gene_type:complete